MTDFDTSSRRSPDGATKWLREALGLSRREIGRSEPSLVPMERIERAILVLRGQRVRLDADSRRHFGTSSSWGGRRYFRYAFAERGVAMLSKRAAQPPRGAGHHRDAISL